jgi:4-hydroxy-2-oxoheptanedioate aldolase
MSFGLMDLAQSLGHPGDPNAQAVKAAVAEASARIHAAGKPVREDFVTVGWVNDILLAGATHVFGDKT